MKITVKCAECGCSLGTFVRLGAKDDTDIEVHKRDYDLAGYHCEHHHSENEFACPDCGSKQTHPSLKDGGCDCPQPDLSIKELERLYGGRTAHINKYHHTCGIKEGG